jgi:predicted GIY-YIG superfamily endonuclease
MGNVTFIRTSPQQEHIVYRMFNDDGELLYVGVTSSFLRRMGDHKRDKPWYDEIGSIERWRYTTREAANQAEWEAIQTENPRHNIARAVPFIDYEADAEEDARWHDSREAIDVG